MSITKPFGKDINSPPKGGGFHPSQNYKLKIIDTSLPYPEDNTRLLHSQRNILKSRTHELMRDRKAAANLDISDPVRPFEYYV